MFQGICHTREQGEIMRAFIITLIVVLAVIFFFGAVSVGGRSLFGHIDYALGTNVCMTLHRTVFFFLYRGQDTVREGVGTTKSDIDRFQRAPAGFDKKRQYEKLDEAAQ
jgi:hypothetical protein